MAAKRSTGQLQAGYECSFVEDLPDDLQSECSICLLVLREPYIVGCCGYRFCRSCIEAIQKRTRRCPLCNSSFSTLPDKHLERVLKEKLVYCPYKGGRTGCKWKGKLVDLEDHVKKCTWQKVQCPHCDGTFTLYILTKFHIKKCSSKRVTCTYCKTHEDTPSQLESVHYAECPMYPVPCPNNCGAKPFRKNISNHVDENCRLTVMDCIFKDAGCDVQLTRREMTEHSSDLEEHAVLCIMKIQELKDEISDLKEQLKSKQSQPIASGSHPIKYLSVTNLPDYVNESMLRSIFGQCGSVLSVALNESLHLATIEYASEANAKAALSRSETRGIKLKSHNLCLSPVYEPS